MGDSLHGSPAIVTYGMEAGGQGLSGVPIKKIFMGTNDGGVHMINAETGVEEWVFMPEALLGNQTALKSNSNGNGSHIYGIDGTITPYTVDINGDGTIDPNATGGGDKVYLFFGMRRGGSNLYALDVTPTATLTSATASGGIVPTLNGALRVEAPPTSATWGKPGQDPSSPPFALPVQMMPKAIRPPRPKRFWSLVVAMI